MAETAFQTVYRQEYISGYEQRMSLLRDSVTTEAMVTGNQAVFLIAGTGGREAVTRGVNGRIPGRPDDLSQVTCTLEEWHDLVTYTGFVDFASQGNRRRIAQQGNQAVMKRKTDDQIITALSAGTVTSDAGAVKISPELVGHVRGILANADVDVDDVDNLFFAYSAAAQAYLEQYDQYTSADYVEMKLFSGRTMRAKRWAGFNWIPHAHLPGAATASETLFAYHRDAIGHAVNTNAEDSQYGLKAYADYDKEQDYSYAAAHAYMGSKLLQNTGVVKVPHIGNEIGVAA